MLLAYGYVTISIAVSDGGSSGFFFNQTGLQYNATYGGWLGKLFPTIASVYLIANLPQHVTGGTESHNSSTSMVTLVDLFPTPARKSIFCLLLSTQLPHTESQLS